MSFGEVLLKDIQEKANTMYETARPFLRKHNGKTHVIFFYLEQSVAFHIGCEEQLTIQLNQLLLGLQKDEYEILDVKLNQLQEKSIAGEKRFLALITYK